MAKKDSAKELWKLSDGDLQKQLSAAKEELYRLKFQAVVDDVTDKSITRKTKKKVARIKTILRARELSESQS